MSTVKQIIGVVGLLAFSNGFAATLGFGDCTTNGVFQYCKAFTSQDEYNAYVAQQSAKAAAAAASQSATPTPTVQQPITATQPAAPQARAMGQTPVAQMPYKNFLEDRVVQCQDLVNRPGFNWMSKPSPALLAREGEVINYMGEPNAVISGGYVQDKFSIFGLKSANDYSYNSGIEVVYGGAIEERSVQKDQNGNVVSTGDWYVAKVGFCNTAS